MHQGKAIPDMQQAIDLQLSGDYESAKSIYMQILGSSDSRELHNDARYLLATLFFQQGEYTTAVENLLVVLAAAPSHANAEILLGNIEQDSGNLDNAVKHYKNILDSDGSNAEALRNLAYVTKLQGDNDKAIEYYRKCISCSNARIEDNFNLAAIYAEQGQIYEAIEQYQYVVRHESHSVEALSNLAQLLQDSGSWQQAEERYLQAIALGSPCPEILNNYGTLLHELGRYDEAKEAYQSAMAVSSSYPDPHLNLALSLLLSGEMNSGWREYEWRLQLNGRSHLHAGIRVWQGQSLEGKRLLVVAEQGYGDSLQFLRFLSYLKSLGAYTILEIQPGLSAICSNVPGIDEVYERTEMMPAIKADFQVSLMSIPAYAGLAEETLSNCIPYIRVQQDRIDRLQRFIDRGSNKLKVGIVWGGRPKFQQDPMRCPACPLANFLPLLKLDNIDWYSLQKGDEDQQIQAITPGTALIDLEPCLDDFADTAAAISLLDLVISVDTSVAHLAGALGTKTWLMLPVAPDWRWLLNREDTPWYPGIRIFRQQAPGDWAQLVYLVKQQLLQLVQNNITGEKDKASSQENALTAAERIRAEAFKQYQNESFSSAKNLFQQLLSLQPQNIEALFYLAVIHQSESEDEKARDYYNQVLKLESEMPEALHNLGMLEYAQGNISLAIDCYRQAVELRPDFTAAICSLGIALLNLDKNNDAIARFQSVLDTEPDNLHALIGLGTALRRTGKLDEAEEVLGKACKLPAGSSQACNNMGNLLKYRGKLHEALGYYQQALSIKPDDPEVLSNQGNTLQALGEVQAAVVHYRQAIMHAPEFAEAHWNLSIASLLTGEYTGGWQEYEWGFKSGQRQIDKPGIPHWTGEELPGQCIRVIAEQGIGDTLQFVRFLPQVRARCGRVILHCQSGLEHLLADIAGVDAVVASHDQGGEAAAYVPLMSLPGILGTQVETIPVDIPYIKADKSRELAWQSKLSAINAYKVGIVWAGNPEHENDRNRSCRLEHFLALQSIEGVQLYSLQRGPGREQLRTAGGEAIIDLADELSDWGETAAVIANLDLVITVDTSVAHLAGALGQRTWTLLPFAPDWRWLLERDDSPWYPQMTLFRQRCAGEWQELFGRVRRQLQSSLLTPGAAVTVTGDAIQDTEALMQQAYQAVLCGQMEQARDLYEQVVKQDPINPIAYNELGNTYQFLKRNDLARTCFQKSIVLQQDYAEPYNGIAALLHAEGKWKASLRNLNKVIDLQDDHVRAHYNRGLLNLLFGEFLLAWPDFEYRLQLPGREVITELRRRWRGEELPGQCIRVIAEQGIGDTLQFVRFLPQVRARCGRVILHCQSGLEHLLADIAGVDAVVASHDQGGEAAAYVPLMSLPGILGTQVETIPVDIPYIKADKSRELAWQSKLSAINAYKVGIVWAGNPEHENDRNRSCRLEHFLALQSIEGVQLYSLQRGPGREQLRTAGGEAIIDLADELSDWGETAAVIANLDLVITVDTSVAHLAGALGQRTWTLLPFAPDWRWLLERDDSPWYPQMTLFRQRCAGEWQELFGRVYSALQQQQLSNSVKETTGSHEQGVVSTQDLLRQGYDFHQSGQALKAEHCYRKILADDPGNKEAMLLLANLLLQQNELQSAAEFTDILRNLDADNPHVYSLSGLIYIALGSYGGAEGFFKKAITLLPGQLYFHDSLATVYKQLGKLTEAIAEYRCCLQINPDHASSCYNMAVIYEQLDDPDQAMSAYQQAIDLDSHFMQAYNNLGGLFSQQGQFEKATSYYQAALECSPENPELYNNLGLVYQEQGAYEKAREYYQKALALQPGYADVFLNLGTVEQLQSNLDAAINYFWQSIELEPDNPVAYNNMGAAMQRKGQLEEAMRLYRESIELDPDYMDGHFNLSLANLLSGDYASGWKGYEWRLKRKASGIRDVTGERWDGAELSGKRILVYSEQGYGDTFQFVRFLPLVKAKGGVVILECQSGLKDTLSRCQGIDELIDWSEEGDRELMYHTSIPLMSLPFVLGITLDSLPAQVPYIKPESQRLEHWQSQFKSQTINIGIVWAGRPTHQNDRNRSCGLSDFNILTSIDGVQIYSLQKGQANQQLHSDDSNIINLDSKINNFADTAAIIQSLDLVITVDTSVAHLAGALGKPVWVVLPFAPDWRWLQQRSDSPWYPSMRLYRQPMGGDWAGLFSQVRTDLEYLLSGEDKLT